MCDVTHQITKSSGGSRNYPNFRVNSSGKAYILQGRARAHEFGTQRTWANLHQGNTHCSRTGGVYLSSDFLLTHELFITFIWFYIFFFHGATLSSIYSFATVWKANESYRVLFLSWRRSFEESGFPCGCSEFDALTCRESWDHGPEANGWEQKCAEGRRHRHGWDGKAAEVSLSQTGAEMDSGGWGPARLMEPGHVAPGRPRQRKPGWKRRKWRWDKVGGSSTPWGPRSAGLQSGRFRRWGPTDVFHSEQLRVLSVPLLQ